MITANTLSPSAYCMDEEYCIYLFKRVLLYLLRGIAAALLMPIEMLDDLRRGHRVHRRRWLSWALSAAMYVCVVEIWRLSLIDGQDRTGTVVCCCLGILLAGIFSGRSEAGEGPAETARPDDRVRAFVRGRYQRRHERPQHRYHHCLLQGIGGQEIVCVKTGLVKRRRLV